MGSLHYYLGSNFRCILFDFIKQDEISHKFLQLIQNGIGFQNQSGLC